MNSVLPNSVTGCSHHEYFTQQINLPFSCVTLTCCVMFASLPLCRVFSRKLIEGMLTNLHYVLGGRPPMTLEKHFNSKSD